MSVTGTTGFRADTAAGSIGARWAAPAEESTAPIIVAIHGGGSDSSYYDLPGASLLQRAAMVGVGVWAPDRPGYGESATVQATTIEEAAAVVGEAITAAAHALFGGRPVVLLGHSIGAVVASAIAADTAITLPVVGLSISGLGPRVDEKGLAMAAALPPQGTVEPPPAPVLRGMLFGRDGTFTQEAFESFAAAAKPLSVSDPRQVNRWPELGPVLAASISAPVQILAGAEDGVWPLDEAGLAEMASWFSTAPFRDVRLIPGAGHAADHHRVGDAIRLRQLAFAIECGEALR